MGRAFRSASYIIVSKLGAGGMAEFFLGDDTRLGRKVALKLLPPDTEADAHAQRRLLRERERQRRSTIRTSARSSKSVKPTGRFITMQFIDGKTLDARVRRAPLDLHGRSPIALPDRRCPERGARARHPASRPRAVEHHGGLARARAGSWISAFPARAHGRRAGWRGRNGIAPQRQRRHRWHGSVHVAGAGARRNARPRERYFSVGALLYELGHRAAAVSATARRQSPQQFSRRIRPARAVCPEHAARLDRIVTKLLKKDRDNRCQTAKDLFSICGN